MNNAAGKPSSTHTGRRYAVWSGNPDGTPQVIGRCIASAKKKGAWISSQCERKAAGMAAPGADVASGNASYCTMHAKRLVAGQHVYTPEDEGSAE